MNLYLVYRQDDCGYDEYDSFVCTAEDESVARLTHPSGDAYVWDRNWLFGHCSDNTWPAPGKLKVTELGTAAEGVSGVLCASFNAG